MSATQELIAAALRLTALAERNSDDGDKWQHAINSVREACARAMVQPAAPDMEEVERLLYAHESAVRAHAAGVGEGIAALATTRTALLDTVRGVLAERDTLIADNERLMQIAAQESDVGTRVLREVFALCEDTQDKCSEDTNDFTRGRRFEAKGIARAIGTWYQDKFCGRTHLGEPALTPDHFRDAAKMVPAPVEVLMPEIEALRLYVRALCRAVDAATDFAGTVAGGASWWDDVWADHAAALDRARERISQAALRGEVKP